MDEIFHYLRLFRRRDVITASRFPGDVTGHSVEYTSTLLLSLTRPIVYLCFHVIAAQERRLTVVILFFFVRHLPSIPVVRRTVASDDRSKSRPKDLYLPLSNVSRDCKGAPTLDPYLSRSDDVRWSDDVEKKTNILILI